MSSSRSFIPLGSPQNATKLVGRPETFVVSPLAQILASNKSQSEVVISPGARFQSSTIVSKNTEKWFFHKSIVVAQHSNNVSETTGDIETVVAAPNGVYRVDIGYGSQFMCDPTKLMGTLGPIRAHIVYTQSRFDVAQFWTSYILQSFGAGLKLTGSLILRGSRFLTHNVSKLVAKVRPPNPAATEATNPVSSYKVPPEVIKYWGITKVYAENAKTWTAAKLFYYTHSPKLQIEGPTSILIKP